MIKKTLIVLGGVLLPYYLTYLFYGEIRYGEFLTFVSITTIYLSLFAISVIGITKWPHGY